MDDIFIVKDKRKDLESVIVLDEKEKAARTEALNFSLNAMQNDVERIENNIETINKIQGENIEKLKNLQRDIEQMRLILKTCEKKTSDNAIPSCSKTTKRKKFSPDYGDFLSVPETVPEYLLEKESPFVTGYDGSPRKKVRESIEEAVECKTEEITEDMLVQAAIQNTKGILTSQELKMFLDLVKLVPDPVQLAKVSFTNKIEKLYFQLVTLKYHLQNALKMAPIESTCLETLEGAIEKFHKSQQ